MLPVLLLVPLAMSSAAALAQTREGVDPAWIAQAADAAQPGRVAAWQADSSASRPCGHLFALPQTLAQPPAASGPGPQPARAEVICGMVVITGPGVDPKIRIPIPGRDVQFAIRTIPPAGCHREKKD